MKNIPALALLGTLVLQPWVASAQRVQLAPTPATPRPALPPPALPPPSPPPPAVQPFVTPSGVGLVIRHPSGRAAVVYGGPSGGSVSFTIPVQFP